ncbi:hypothetical protein F5X98DRAFT_165527 [Xylaria grammica]|nr:hypothetical protein F5X98DRAFT_165527 [Xylaria grammica]
MREFMDYIQSAFYGATGWNRDNSYATLNATSDALLHFATPRGLRLTLSSLATPHFATAYQLGTVGIVDGSISYLYSTVPLNYHAVAQSEKIPLPELLQSYSPLAELGRRNRIKGARQDVLAYGRLYLPKSMLEALMVKRISPTLQMQVSAVSDQTLRNGGTVLGMLQYDEGRYGVEGLASSDGGLMGIRGLYNFGGDVAASASASASPHGIQENGNGTHAPEKERIYGRFSTGGELYYGTLNKSGGMSLGIRFATLPSHKGTPLTATMTVNPLMGTLSWTYAVMAGRNCSLGTKMDFNVYSYESAWSVGVELWRKKGAWTVDTEIDDDVNAESIAQPNPLPQRSFQAKMEWRMDDPLPLPDTPDLSCTLLPQVASEPITPQRTFRAKLDWRENHEDEGEDLYSGVLKARLDHHWRIGLLWEGRIKSLLFSLGSGIDLRRPDSPFRTLGLEVQFSS